MNATEPHTLPFEIESVQLLNEDVYHILLRCQPAQRPVFFAGQYLLAHPAGGPPCAFSIASTPALLRDEGRIELHFRAQADNPGSEAFREAVTQERNLQISLPHGNCHVGQPPEGTTLLVAGSTGFAQIKSIAEHLLQEDFRQELHIYWGGRLATDLYLRELPARWASAHDNVIFHPVLSAAHEAPTEEMRDGWLHQAILEDFSSVDGLEIFVSGSPGMVYSVYDSLTPHGATRERFHSDVFDYAPR